MKKFNYSNLKNKLWDIKIINYLTRIHEEKGKQELYLKQRPQELERLVVIAKIQSTESSNEIEGIKTTNSRLKQLVNEKTTPKNREEEEIAGYRDALNIIHENFDSITINPNFILQLHKVLFSYTTTSYGGKYKNVQNYISAINEKGETHTLFTPLSPVETPIAMQELCKEFNKANNEGFVDPLILIPLFIHDFLCIHPFIDGNGRMSRLLTTLLLYRSGYYVGKYISLEVKIAKNKDLYYDAIAGIMDKKLCDYYQALLKNPTIRKTRCRSSSNLSQINRTLKKYKKGHQLTNTEKQIYETINEMNQTSQQKVLRKI